MCLERHFYDTALVMTKFEDFFVSPSLKTRLLNSKTSTVTSGFSGMHEYPLKDLLAFNSEEIIASEYVKFLAKREHGQQKQKKPRYAVSIVQRSHFWTEAEKSPATSSALETVINAFFKRIFTNTNNAWTDMSTKLSAFVMLHERTPPETKINGFDLLDGLKEKPQIIFITSKADYAVKAFDYEGYIFNNKLSKDLDWTFTRG